MTTELSFVRDRMVPEQEPPLGEKGALKWVRENLFSGWLNILLTLLSIAVIYWIVSHLATWLLNSVWNAGSLSECREVLAAHATGPNTTGACWGVIRDRWLQLLVGSYPPDLLWRPILALVLLAVSISPVLFPERVPRKVLILSVLYPFILPWLIWGGSFWVPVLVIVGFAVGSIVYRVLAGIANVLTGFVGGVLAALLWWIVAMPLVNDMLHRTIASARMDTALVEAREQAAALPSEIAALQDQQDALNARIADLVATKDALIEEIRADRFRRQIGRDLPRIVELVDFAPDVDFDTVLERFRELRDILDPYNPSQADPALGTPIAALRNTARSGVPRGEDDAPVLTEEARATLDAMAAQAAEATAAASATGLSDADLADKVARFDALMIEITRLREESTEIGSQIFRTDETRRAAANIARNIQLLQRNEEDLPALRAEAARLRSELPASVAGIAILPDNRSVLGEDVSAEDFNALADVIRAEDRVIQADISITSTYKTVGLVGLTPVTSDQLGGFQLSMLIGVIGIIMSLPIGVLLALARQSDLLIIRMSSVAFIEVIRGVPLIVWLMVANFLLNFFLPPGTEFDKVLRVIVMVTLFASAYIAEVVRGGLAALPKGQYEAADSLGLDYWKSMRLIVLPQALKISIPGIVNTFIGLFKDTTLVVFIGLLDPIALANSIRASTEWNGIYWELFIFIGLLFFTFCYAMGRYSIFLEGKLAREHR